MSIATSTSKIQYTLAATVQALPIPFYFLENAHVKAIRARSGAADYVMVLGTDYTLAGAADEAGGTLTTIATNLVIGDKITIKRDITITQQVNYVYNDRFPAETHERALDKLTMITQQLKEVVDRSVQFPESEVAGTGNIMPSASGRAAKILGFDATGNAIQLYDPVSVVFASGDAIYTNSVAALKAVPVVDLLNGQQVHVAGYANAGDGGGGKFVYVAASAVTENVGTIVAPNVGVGRWLRVYDGPINPRWFGAIGDGLSDDTLALQAALDVGEEVFLPVGTWGVSDTIEVPHKGSLRGTGAGSVIKALSVISGAVLSIDRNSLFGNRDGVVENLYLNGDSKAAIGLYVGLAVQRQFSRITATLCTVAGVVVDSAQNSHFDCIEMISNEKSMLLLNGAGNNLFTRCEFDTATSSHLTVKTDAAYGGYVWNLFSRVPTSNTFIRCVFERVSGGAFTFITITNGKANIFQDCDLANSALGILISAGNDLNKIIRFYFNGGSGTVAIEQRGFGTVVENCIFESYANGSEVVQCYNRTFIFNLHFSSSTYVVASKSGDSGDNVRWTDGTIYASAESPPTSSLRPGKFYYNSLDEWYARGRSATVQLQTGTQRDKSATGAAGTAHQTTQQLEGGIWLVAVSARNGDGNNTRSGVYILHIKDASANDLTTVAQIGADVTSGTVVTVLTPTVTAAGLLTVDVTTSSSQTVTIQITAKKIGNN